MHKRALGGLVIALLYGTALGQSSPSFTLDEHTFNNGGTPGNAAVPTSTSFRITLSALGDTTTESNLTSASFRGSSSFLQAYPPPGEATGLRFATGKQDLVWDPERSRVSYNLYRGLFSSLTTLTYGGCEQQTIAAETANVPDEPGSGDGYFYLVTVENRLSEEGTKGYQGDGVTERLGAVCP